MLRIASGVAALALAAAVGCSGSDGTDTSQSAERARSGEVVVVRVAKAPAWPYVAGNRLYRAGTDDPRELGGPLNTLLLGTLSPAAVPDPTNADVLAYTSWRRNRPVVRIYDASGGDALVEDGAYSVAWRSDGALAYVKALPEGLDLERVRDYVGHVVVRAARKARPVRWTTATRRYVVAAWAGRRLLAYRLGPGWPDLLVFDGPRRQRVLAEAGALVAVSPDGGRVFVTTYGASPPIVRVLDVADGTEIASLELSDPVEWIVEAGSWEDERVVAKASAGLVVFRVVGDEIAVEQVVEFSRAGLPLGVFEPQLRDREIFAWAQREDRPRQAVPDAVVIACDRFALRCVPSAPVSAADGPRLAYNPSRP